MNYETMDFRTANKLNDADFARYAEAQNKKFVRGKAAAGWLYFPTINRWFPAGTKIAGLEPEQHPLAD